jgi:hypothetical protein
MSAMKLSPRSITLAIIAAPVAYVFLALIVPPLLLRDIFNPLAFAVFAVIAATWARDAIAGLRAGMQQAAWFLVFGVFHLSFVTTVHRTYVIVFNALDRPLWLSEGMFAGFWAYSYFLAGLTILYAAGMQQHGDSIRAWTTSTVAVFLGGMIAGAGIALSIASFW